MSHREAGGTNPWPRGYGRGTHLGQEAKVQVELELTVILVEIFSRQLDIRVWGQEEDQINDEGLFLLNRLCALKAGL